MSKHKRERIVDDYLLFKLWKEYKRYLTEGDNLVMIGTLKKRGRRCVTPSLMVNNCMFAQIGSYICQWFIKLIKYFVGS